MRKPRNSPLFGEIRAPYGRWLVASSILVAATSAAAWLCIWWWSDAVTATAPQRGFATTAQAAVQQPAMQRPTELPQLEQRPQLEQKPQFEQKPRLVRQGDGWVISFAVRSACDATVLVRGPDGKIIRHLASGVLGENAPPPLQTGALSQSIFWDGRDDRGRPAPPGWKVEVGLGLHGRFDKALGWDPQRVHTNIDGIAVDRHGQLYVLCDGPHIRVFDRQGKYIRTLLPPAANVRPEDMTLIEWTGSTLGRPAVYRPRSGGSSTFDLYRFAGFRLPKQAMGVTPDGRLALVTNLLDWGLAAAERGRRLVMLSATDGATPPGSIVQLDQAESRFKPGLLGNDGRPFVAISPDGGRLYLSGLMAQLIGGQREPIHAVFVVKLDRPGLAEPFFGDPTAADNTPTRLDQPRGLACDAQGNLYVCDYGNHRVVVVSPQGRLLKSMAVKHPDQIAVHSRTGEIYLLRATPNQHHFDIELVKLSSVDQPNPVASMSLPRNAHRIQVLMALDASAQTPALWFGAVEGHYGVSRTLWRVEDRGDAFQAVVQIGPAAEPTEPWQRWNPLGNRAYIAADPLREELYVRVGEQNCFPDAVIRVDGRTGKPIELIDARVEQVYVGPDGLAYMRIEDGGEWLVRYDPDQRKFIPMTAPEARPALRGGYGRKKYDFAGREPVVFRGETVIGVYVPANPGARTWQDPFCVAPNGDIYIPVGVIEEHIAALQKAGLKHPKQPQHNNYCLLQVYSADGQPKWLSILPGLGHSAGVRVGRSGAVYVVLACQPASQPLPDGIAPHGKFTACQWGTLLRFPSPMEVFPIGEIAGRWNGQAPEKPTHFYGTPGGSFDTQRGTPVVISGVRWQYGGVSPISLSGCTCLNSHFDVDGFERAFVPALQTATVNVLDCNGNLMVRIGRFGNADSRGPESPVLDPKSAQLRPRRPDDPPTLRSPLDHPEPAFAHPRFIAVTDEAVYVHDMDNQRIVRAVLEYHARESCAP